MYFRTMAKLDKFVPAKFMPMWQHPAGTLNAFHISNTGKPINKLSSYLMICNHLMQVQKLSSFGNKNADGYTWFYRINCIVYGQIIGHQYLNGYGHEL